MPQPSARTVSKGAPIESDLLTDQCLPLCQVNPHYLESYRTALQAAMLLHFTRRGAAKGRAGVLALGQNPGLRALLAAEG